MAFVVGLGFIGIAFLYTQYLYFFLVIALLAIVYGFKQLKKHDTPFQRHEREMRRHRL